MPSVEKKAASKRGMESRLQAANQIIEAIASCGRRFLSMNSDRPGKPDPNARISRFELASGRVWYVDKYRAARIYVHTDFPWRRGWTWRFSEGGTLLDLLRHLRDFIVKGTPVNPGYFGPFAQWCCDGDPWGYGEDMTILRRKVEAILQTGPTGAQEQQTREMREAQAK